MKPSFEKKLGILAGVGAAYVAWQAYKDSMRKIDFKNRVVVITGGSRGLGLVLARQFAREGAKLAICSRREDELEIAQNELLEFGVPVLAQVCDMQDRDQVAKFIDTVRNDFGRIDVLVNNAGIIQVGPLDSLTHADFERAMDTHFWGVLHAVEEVLPTMRHQGFGRIVNIASIGGRLAVPHLIPYSASKFALVGFSDSLRAELAREKIFVTTVCPGLMRTGSPRNATFKGKHRAEYAWFSVGSSIPFLSMSAEQAANKIVDACRYGRAKVTLSLPAKLGVVASAIIPELVADLMGLANVLLPEPGGIGKRSALGKESSSWVSPSVVTTLSDQAATKNNEMVSG